MRLFIVIGILLIPLTTFLFNSTPLATVVEQHKATLTVTNASLPLVLYIDGELIGTLPLETLSIPVGLHTLSLRNVVGDEQNAPIWWQEELDVSDGDEVILHLQVNDATLESVLLTRIFTKHDSNNISRVFVNPRDVTLKLNDQEFSSYPALIEEDEVTKKSISIVDSKYPDVFYELNISETKAFESHVQVFFDLIAATELAHGVTLVNQDMPDRVINRRWDWEESFVPVPASALASGLWSDVSYFQLPVSSEIDPVTVLRDLEDSTIQRGYGFRVPFCFIVAQDGSVYEGLGIWGYDFSQLDNIPWKTPKNVCPILFLGPTLTQQHRESLTFLHSFVKGVPSFASQVVSANASVELSSEELITYSYSLQNTGWTTWRNTENTRIEIRRNNNRKSELFNQDIWESQEVITRITDEIIIPGAITEVNIPIKAPQYSVGFDETFSLWRDGTQIQGSSVTVHFTVKGTGKGVEILDTATGFLNVRETPTLNGTLLASVYPGEHYALLESQGEWHKIRLDDGRDGWVFGNYVKEI